VAGKSDIFDNIHDSKSEAEKWDTRKMVAVTTQPSDSGRLFQGKKPLSLRHNYLAKDKEINHLTPKSIPKKDEDH